MIPLHLRFLSLVLAGGTAYSQTTLNVSASRGIGQPQLLPNNQVSTYNPNLVEGRELYSPQSIALDTSLTPPALYIADTGNNRILGWKNATAFTNGKHADLVVGQRDFCSTNPGGPATAFTAGLSAPTGLAVFGSDLYVVDAGNNRVLRFRKPLATPASSVTGCGAQDQQFPDMIIGQPSLARNTPNYPGGSPNEKGIFLASSNSGAFQAAITFDKQGNLWLTDAGNRRVLMYPASDVAKSNNFGIAATIVIGQTDFLSAAVLDSNSISRTNQLAVPAGLAFDAAGRLYVSDSDTSNNPADPLNRVLVFNPPFSSGQSAARIMGLLTPLPAGVTPPDQRTQNIQNLQIRMNNPNSIFFLPGTQGMGVVDSGWSRILIFPPYDQWPDASTATSPSSTAVVGQGGIYVKPDGTLAIQPNAGNPKSSEQTLAFPTGAVFFNNELYVADSGNHRALVLPLQTGTFGSATRLLGQDRYDSNAVNLIEGREFRFSSGNGAFDSGLAIDSTGDVPHLYVADTYNNRILGFKDLRNLKPGAAADIVIGQPDMATALCNPTNDNTAPTQSSLCGPRGLVVDSAGNLYVADAGNGRVLRFPTPFAHQGQQQADLVLGQHDYFTKITDPTSRTMAFPYGLAIIGTNGLAVSDTGDSRVLFFKFTANGTFTGGTDNGLAATKVFGQPDFSTIVKGSSDTQMNSPRLLSSDSDGRLYVADTANGRVLIYDQINNAASAGAHATLTIPGFNNPEAVFVNQVTGEVWVTNTSGGTVLKYPKYDALQFNLASNGSVNAASLTLAVVQDQFGNLIVADASNRVALYYPPLTSVNAANLMPNRALTPGVFATIYASAGTTFGKGTAVASDLPNYIPYPTTLGDIQVLVRDASNPQATPIPAPLYYVGTTQINFLVPMSAPTGGNAEIQVVKVSTGQLMAISSVIPMNTASPGIFEISGTGTSRQAAVINQDGTTINSATSPAKRGEVISIYATGQGFLPNAPADGDIPRNGLVSTPTAPRILIGDFLDNIALTPNDPQDRSFVKFSGLSPTIPGIWQINVQIPFGVAPGVQPLLVTLNSIPSIDRTVTGYITVIYVQ